MKDDKIDLEKISKKDLLTELRIHMMSFNRRMGEIKSPHKLLEVLLTYVVCVTYDVLQESTNEATMLIGASWGRVINDIAKEKGMTRKEVFFQAIYDFLDSFVVLLLDRRDLLLLLEFE